MTHKRPDADGNTLCIFPLPHFLQEVEQLRLERLQIDEQLRQLTQGHRPVDREREERGEREGYNTDGSANASSSSLHVSRTYNGRGRGRRGHNTGYGAHV